MERTSERIVGGHEDYHERRIQRGFLTSNEAGSQGDVDRSVTGRRTRLR